MMASPRSASALSVTSSGVRTCAAKYSASALDLGFRESLGQRIHGVEGPPPILEVVQLFDDVLGVKPRQFRRHHARYGRIARRSVTGLAGRIEGSGVIGQGGGAHQNAGRQTQHTQNH